MNIDPLYHRLRLLEEKSAAEYEMICAIDASSRSTYYTLHHKEDMDAHLIASVRRMFNAAVQLAECEALHRSESRINHRLVPKEAEYE